MEGLDMASLDVSLGNTGHTYEYMTTKSPYIYETTNYEAPPCGYEQVFINYLGRHGSRHLSGAKYDYTLYQLLAIAVDAGQITELGRELQSQIKKLIVIEKDNYGLLTSLGKTELRNIGVRTGRNYQKVFADGKPVLALGTFETRTQESRDQFLAGFNDNVKGNRIIASFYTKNQDPYLRPYDLATNYKKFVADGAWREKYREYGQSEIGKKYSWRVLTALFTDAFYQRLASGEFQLKDDRGKVKLKNPLDAATNLYNLYIMTPSLNEDGGNFDFQKYFTAQELAWFESVVNLKEFLLKGPSLTGVKVTTNLAAPLVKDLIVSSEQALKSKKYAGKFAFAHAETVIPLCAFLDLSAENISTDDPNEVAKVWNGSVVSPLGANIMWVFYYNGQDYLVKMLQNEKEIAFPLKTAIYPFYKWEDVKEYYSKKVNALGINLDNNLEQDITALKERF